MGKTVKNIINNTCIILANTFDCWNIDLRMHMFHKNGSKIEKLKRKLALLEVFHEELRKNNLEFLKKTQGEVK